jgi:(2Fe-2S) ferredoxin
MPRPLRHLLICSNNRGPGHPRGSCGEKGGEKFVGLMKDLIRAGGFRDRVLVSRTGCLKHCSLGVTAAVYPENVWYCGVEESDLKEIYEAHLAQGTPVDRLRLSEEAPWE